ncbi:MAG: 5'-3' exonuclease H3TH domain-containing protein, partial [Stackebrandtia sp.]
FEADDILATLATQAADEGFETLICSGDRDAFQLVTKDTTVLYPVKGVSELARMTPEAVEAKYGVPPDRYRDLAALVGEKSDNLPGVPGVGPKTAAKWIAGYDGLDGVIAAADSIKGKAGENLRAHLADVMRNQQLNKLVCDVELPYRPEALVWGGWDAETSEEVFTALEFAVLHDRIRSQLNTKRVGEALPVVAGETEPEAEFQLLATGELSGWLTDHGYGTRVGVAASGEFGRGSGRLTGLALATSGHAAWCDPAQLDADDEPALAAWLADISASKAIHDAKATMLACRAQRPDGGPRHQPAGHHGERDDEAVRRGGREHLPVAGHQEVHDDGHAAAADDAERGEEAGEPRDPSGKRVALERGQQQCERGHRDQYGQDVGRAGQRGDRGRRGSRPAVSRHPQRVPREEIGGEHHDEQQGRAPALPGGELLLQ